MKPIEMMLSRVKLQFVVLADEASRKLKVARTISIGQIKMPAATEEKVLASNRAAFHEYHILDKYEAGIALTGTEVKSVLGGRVQLKEGYVAIRDGEAWLFNAHISPYAHGNRENHEPLRTRKLLLHRREIEQLGPGCGEAGDDAGCDAHLSEKSPDQN